MSDARKSSRGRIIAATAVAALLVTFAALSWAAIRTKSATADEPLHALGGYMKLLHGDFRLNCEDPPLFAYWAMIPHNARTLEVPTDSPVWQHMLEYLWRRWRWCQQTFYETPANDPDAFLSQSRGMMLLLGVALGGVIASWAWRLAGPLAAIVATALYCFDPNFLGHSPLVKNDVALTLVLTAVMFVTWSMGRAIRLWNLALLALLCGVALNVKFSGLIVAPIVGLILLLRAIRAEPWPVMRMILTSRGRRVSVVLLADVICAATAVGVTWASYGFRFAPTGDAASRFDTDIIIKAALVAQERAWKYDRNEDPTEEELERFSKNRFIRTIEFADSHRLMPHAWLAGLLDTYATTRSRSNFLHGNIYVTGSWRYFPLAMLYKTPLASVIAIAAAVAVSATVVRAKRKSGQSIFTWDLLCLIVPTAVYGYSIVTSNVNLGLRHAFPVYPFSYLFVGIACAAAHRLRPRTTTTVAGVLAIGLAAESLKSYPDYIAFFNTAAGGSRGGIELLGDSNLDWGQDLLLLQQWRKDHPDVNLYVSYFGMADPRYYLNYTPMPGDVSGAGARMPDAPGIAAISATNLQGIYVFGVDELARARYVVTQHTQKPIAVLGGTIYLYEVTPQSPLFVAKP